MIRYLKLFMLRKKNQVLSKVWPNPFAFHKTPLKKTGRDPNILHPKDFRDLVLNTMTFPDNSLRAVVADKLATRGYVEEKLGAVYLPDIYDCCDEVEDLTPENYPLPFVVKPNHASGRVRLIYNADDLALLDDAIKEWKAYKHNPNTEWVYNGIEPQYIVEKMLCGANAKPLPDYKIICFFGEPVHLWKDSDRFGNHRRDIFTPEWEPIDAEMLYPQNKEAKLKPSKPVQLPKMLEIARLLSKDFSFMRVDLYADDQNVYVGELTSFTEAGNIQYTPIEFDQQLYQLYLKHQQRWISSQRQHYKNKAMQKLRKVDTPAY